jgi:hypothetical protein
MLTIPRKRKNINNKMNALITALQNEQNTTLTENSARALKSTLKHAVDFFGLGGALRARTDSDVISLFSQAFAEDPLVALKTLFYIRDVRGGQGERKTFRTCLNWLAREYPETLARNIDNIVEFGRWDDLYATRGTTVWTNHALPRIAQEWNTNNPSLMYKWLASENTSSKTTREIGGEIRSFLKVSPKAYRKTLSARRAELDVVERKMCAKQWTTINYQGVPSKAALRYKDAFVKHDAVRYSQFIADVKSGKATINARVLYPYEIVEKALARDDSATLDVLWNSLPDYIGDDASNSIVVADVSGSMSGRPMDVSISLAMYISERNKGAFKDKFITFSEQPSLQSVIGNNIRERVSNLASADWGQSTNLEAVFDLILGTAQKHNVPAADMPTKVYIVSDMEFDQACRNPSATLFEAIQLAYEDAGYQMPELVFWNVNARNTHAPVRFDTQGTCLVSGCSPTILTSLLSGKIVDAQQVMMDTLNKPRYNSITV